MARPDPDTAYHKDSSVRATGQRHDGAKRGDREWFRLDGSKMRSGHVENGEPIGEWITYDRTVAPYRVTTREPKPT